MTNSGAKWMQNPASPAARVGRVAGDPRNDEWILRSSEIALVYLLATLLAAAAFALVLAHFMRQRGDDGAWREYRRRQRERTDRAPPEYVSDPNVQFDSKPDAAGESSGNRQYE